MQKYNYNAIFAGLFLYVRQKAFQELLTFVHRTIGYEFGQVLLSMPSLGVSSLDFDRVGNDAVFFYPAFAPPILRRVSYSAASGRSRKSSRKW